MKIRLIKENDIDSLMELVHQAGPGLTNLPNNKQKLLEKIQSSQQSVKANNFNDPHLYFFVLEDTSTNKIVGCCAILSKVGVKQPFYSLRVLNITHTSRELNYYEPVQVLQMVEEHHECSEVMMLFLAPEYRHSHNGKLLSYSRFLFISQFIERFPKDIIAEMRGNVDENGISEFWENLGGRFIPMNFVQADKFNAIGHYQFIADLMPKYPIYIRLLSDKAQEMIGKTHPHTVPAVKMLEKEGFRADGTIDVFDAGPTLRCPINELNTVKKSRLSKVSEIEEHLTEEFEKAYICTTDIENFELTIGFIKILNNNEVALFHDSNNALAVKLNDEIRYLLLNAN